MLQNATPLKKSSPWPPNTSNSCVCRTAPATRHASFQILFECPAPAILFETAPKPSRFAHFWPGAQSLVPTAQSDIWTSKSAPYPSVFCTDMCFAPQRPALLRHLNSSKCSGAGVFWTFLLGNVLRTATACNFESLIWPAGSAPAALASLLFDPPELQIIGKHSVSRLSSLFAHLHLLSSDSSLLWSSLFCSSLPTSAFPSVHIVGSLTSKLPSIKQ